MSCEIFLTIFFICATVCCSQSTCRSIPFGIQHSNPPTSSFRGWTRCYYVPYSDFTTMNKLETLCPDAGPNTMWFVGAIDSQTNPNVIFLGALVKRSIAVTKQTQYTQAMNVMNMGGRTVYFYNGITRGHQSFGFAPTSSVVLSNCDTTDGPDRLCWHTFGAPNGGYRAGRNMGLDGDNKRFYKVIYTISGCASDPTAYPTREPTTSRPTTSLTTSTTNPCPNVCSIPCGLRNMISCMATSTCLWNKVLQTCGCAGIASDYVFVVDRSGSIGQENAITQKNIVKNIIATMVPEKSNIGIITYSTTTNSFIALNSSLTKSEIVSKISEMPYSRGETYTEKALRLALTSPNYLGNVLLKRYQRIVLITDGVSTYPDDPCKLSNDILAKTGLKVVVVGVSSGFVRKNVECLVANQPNSAEWILEMPTFSMIELEKIRDKLEPKVCVVGKSASNSVQVLTQSNVVSEGGDVEKENRKVQGSAWIVGVLVSGLVMCIGCVVAGWLSFKSRQSYEKIPSTLTPPTETTVLRQ